MDHEIIDAAAANSTEALKALAKLREALQTLPFFGSGKAIWFKDCNFLADERTALSHVVTESLADLTQELEMLHQAREDALAILAQDPKLAAKEHRALRAALSAQFGESLLLVSSCRLPWALFTPGACSAFHSRSNSVGAFRKSR